MARTRSTARKSTNGLVLGRRSSLFQPALAPPGTMDASDLLALLGHWLVTLLSTLVSTLATHMLATNARILDQLPLLRTLCNSLAMPQPAVVRTITASLDATDDDANARNMLLQTAVTTYIARHCAVAHHEYMHYELIGDLDTVGSDALDIRDSNGDDNVDNDDSKRACEALRLTPQLARPTDTWLRLTPDIEFQQTWSPDAAVHFWFRAATSHAIDAFVDCAFAQHVVREKQQQRQATERFYYERLAGDAAQQFSRLKRGSGRATRVRLNGRGRGRGRGLAPPGMAFTPQTQPATVQLCRRYRLLDTTTFASLFFDAKVQLKQTLDAFTSRTGAFAPRRFAHRLGVFVYGQSSAETMRVAKAIAHCLQRHVVHITASAIATNRDAIDLLQDLNVGVVSSDSSSSSSKVKFDFQDIVLVLDGIDELVFATPSDDTKDKTKDSDDRLTVQGLLAALDGMVDTPERVVVMTARDGSRVHPALVRPRRVHCAVDLSSVSVQSAQQLIEHYVAAPLDDAQLVRLQQAMHARRHDADDSDSSSSEWTGDDAIGWTAADLETLCLEHADADAVLQALGV